MWDRFHCLLRSLRNQGKEPEREQGLTPLQILRSYYPKDIEIVETNTITNVLSSYPGTPLRTGSTGLDVQPEDPVLRNFRNTGIIFGNDVQKVLQGDHILAA